MLDTRGWIELPTAKELRRRRLSWQVMSALALPVDDPVRIQELPRLLARLAKNEGRRR
jgi:hypothetical protein